MTDTTDIPAIIALLTRASKAFASRERAQADLESAQKSLDEANQQIANATAAFALFDLQVGHADHWNKIRQIVGEAAYADAIRKGKDMAFGGRLPPLPAAEIQEEEEEEETEEHDDSSVMLFEEATADRPSIRELTLNQLRAAGAVGTKARAIRQFIENTYKVRLHYKTVGMTLYRLSQDGLARREGQTWFIVPGKSETMNPGAVTPGLQSMLE